MSEILRQTKERESQKTAIKLFGVAYMRHQPFWRRFPHIFITLSFQLSTRPAVHLYLRGGGKKRIDQCVEEGACCVVVTSFQKRGRGGSCV